MGAFKAVIFDLDGTLLDTIADLTDSVNTVFDRYGLPLRTSEDVRRNLGNGAHFLMSHLMPAGSDDHFVREVQAVYEPYYQNHCDIKTAPYEGIMDLLAALNEKGIACAIVSNKGDGAVKALGEKYFSGLLQSTVGNREGIRRKPAPDSVLEAMRLLESTPDNTLYVGDSEVDYECAKAAKVPCALVSWGFRPRQQLLELKPDYLVDRADELRDIILGG